LVLLRAVLWGSVLFRPGSFQRGEVRVRSRLTNWHTMAAWDALTCSPTSCHASGNPPSELSRGFVTTAEG
ncbi:unnamed protein product, partial [Closterium sp. Naga37s-1]